MSAPVRVVVADRVRLIRDVVRIVCERSGIELVSEASSNEDLLAACRHHRPDVVISEDMLDDGDLAPHVGDVLSTGARVLVLCQHLPARALHSLMGAGVSGCLVHDTTPAQMTEAVRCLADGRLPPPADGSVGSYRDRLPPPYGEGRTDAGSQAGRDPSA